MIRWPHIALLLCLSCVKPDIQLDPKFPDHVQVQTDIERPKVYVNIANRTLHEARTRSFWHLRFQNGENQWGIFLNPFVDMAVYGTGSTNFNANFPSILSGARWTKDILKQGELTSAIGNWGHFEYEQPSSYQEVYLVLSVWGQDTTIYKLQMLNAENNAYRMRYAELFGGETVEYLITKDPYRENGYFSLYDQSLRTELEPKRNDWQMEFTYTADSSYFSKGEPAYVIGGVPLYPTIFLNRGVEITLELEKPFEDVDYFGIRDMQFSHRSYLSNPFIQFDPVSEAYTANSDVTMLCRWQGQYCKMRLLSLEQGSSGEFLLNLELQNL